MFRFLIAATQLLSLFAMLCISKVEASKNNTAALSNSVRSSRLIVDQPNDVSIDTAFGRLVCAAGSSVFFMETDNALIVLALESASAGIKLVAGKKEVDFSPGEEIVLTRDRSAKLTNLITVIPLSFRNPMQCDLRGGLRMFQMEFSIPEAMAKVEELKVLTKSNKPSDKKAVRKILKNAAILQKVMFTAPYELGKGFVQALTPTAPLLGQISMTQDLKTVPADFQFDAVVDLTIPLSQHNPTITEDVHLVSYTDGVWLDAASVDVKKRSKSSSSAVMVCSKSTLVRTHHGFVLLKNGSSALINDSAETVAVSVIGTEGTRDVSILAGTGLISLRPGQQFISTDLRSATYDQVSKYTDIAYREPRTMTFENRRLFLADFSIPAAACSLPPLSRIALSANVGDRKAAQNMLKSAAVLQHISIQDGPYKQVSKAKN